MEGTEPNDQAKGSAVKAMVSFFTIFHLDIDEGDMHAMERRFWLAPLLGCAIGLMTMGVLFLLYLVDAPWPLYAITGLATPLFVSKFLHFDGLADFGDSMICPGDQQARVRALKDTLIGAGGVGVALIVTLMTFSAYLSMVTIFSFLIMAVSAEICAKNGMVAAAAIGIPGNGMAGEQVRRTTVRSLVLSLVLSEVLLNLVVLLIELWEFEDEWCFNMIAVILPVVSTVVGVLMARKANKSLGMVNGDILGATNEVSRCICCLAMAVILGALVW
ncbi:MAG: adenosylcobinamide-GDP ribazoletransferase [Candidatus Methanomethylophilaceae archaeon]|nr:adenosylcobinamide-GDP ribazoletransferase [Candidatus Methanomethylophilaceae archaeon]